MIKQEYVAKGREKITWTRDFMIEQDMIISRVLIALYENEMIREKLVFRGGTALNKLFLKPPARYSEDIDFVQLSPEKIGEVSKAIRRSLLWLEEASGLGSPEYSLKKYGLKYYYKFTNVEGAKSKLKIEINTREHFYVDPLQEVPFSFRSDWWIGSSSIVSYSLEELMGTKLRALYQRRKGRDLFDTYYVLSQGWVDIAKVIRIFHTYNERNGIKITQRMFYKNMEEKQSKKDFRQDIVALLPVDTNYSFDTAFNFVMSEVATFI